MKPRFRSAHMTQRLEERTYDAKIGIFKDTKIGILSDKEQSLKI